MGEIVLLGVFALLTLALSREDPSPGDAPKEDRGQPARHPDERGVGRLRLLVQLALLLVLAALSVSRRGGIFLWSGFLRRLGAVTVALPLPLPHPNFVINPVLYVLLPGAVILALGARPRDLGFRRGWRVGRVVALWLFPIAALWVFLLATGSWSVAGISRRLLSNFFQNGFSEEFLFRGAIQTRISRLLDSNWGLVLASMAFGIWHLDSVRASVGGSLAAALAVCVVVQAPAGLALGFVFQRTRNLAAPTIIHMAMDAVEP